MTKNKKYSVKKVTVAVTSILMGVSAGSLGTAYAQQDNDIKPAVEIKHNNTEGHLNKPIIEGKNLAGTSKPDGLNEVAPKTIEKSVEKPTEKPVEPAKDDKTTGEAIGEKVDWNSIDAREFLNHIISDAKADKNKEHEIKVLWLTKIKDLLTVYPNNENLQKIKTILEEDLKKDGVKEEKPSENNKEVSKDKDKKEVPKEEKTPEDKKDNKEVSKDKDKKEVPKDEKTPEDKKDNKEVSKDKDKKEAPKEEKTPEDKKDNKEVSKDKDKKETSKEEQSSEGRNVKKELKKETPKKETTEKQGNLLNSAADNHVLSSKLSGRDVNVSFDKNKIKADEVFVGAINDENLNKEIINKLGNEYKVVEVFEIHFKKDGKKLDSDAERTVKVSVVKNNSAKLEVYHIADNNVLEKVDSSFSDGVVQFKINHFSKFTILERIRVGAKDLESRVQIVTPVKAEYNAESIQITKTTTANNQSSKKGENIKKENEDLPKTGLKTTDTFGIALLSLGIVIAIRRKQRQ
ncbi:IgA FC receptor [uncultured Gemella sp.]|uniref:IgA FC receptor n=1 Tax=uncultured Gemella sp. TaxID=254352 RepID=UPI0028D15ADA|nr:IgA FC receptor [uncultured Gemella sp.]